MSPFDADGSENPRRWWPWRLAVLGWLVAVLVLAAATPLFLCMPPWNDVTLHDMAVRSMLRGGVHYRDVFDTNLPGIDWLMAGVRFAAGWRYEALRAVDLAVMAAAVALLLAWASRAGANGAAIAWLAAAAALYYPFTSEFNHVQRDPWLLLPALIAMRMRYGRVEASGEVSSPINTVFEGIVWGAAVWIKPHVIVPAAAVWFVSAILIARREIWVSVFQDLFWLIVGGLIAGGAGVAWLVATGAWPHFLDIFLNWNPRYLADVWPATVERLAYTTHCFPPWSLLHFVAVPLAFLAFFEARLWSRRSRRPRTDLDVAPALLARRHRTRGQCPRVPGSALSRLVRAGRVPPEGLRLCPGSAGPSRHGRGRDPSVGRRLPVPRLVRAARRDPEHSAARNPRPEDRPRHSGYPSRTPSAHRCAVSFH